MSCQSYQLEKMSRSFLLSLVALIFFYPILSTASLALNIPQPSTLPSNTSQLDRIIPHCFNDRSHPSIHPVVLGECQSALRALVQEPGFSQSHWFSRNHRRGIQVPRGWSAGDCVVFVTCKNDYDADIFRYADVLRIARGIIDMVSPSLI